MIACPSETRCDRLIAERLNDPNRFSALLVSYLRLLYDEARMEKIKKRKSKKVPGFPELTWGNLDDNNIAKMADVLRKFKNNLLKKDFKDSLNPEKIDENREALRQAFSEEAYNYGRETSTIIRNRANAVLHHMIGAIDLLQLLHPEVTRELLLRGIRGSKGTYGGIPYILDIARQSLYKNLFDAKEKADEDYKGRIDEIAKENLDLIVEAWKEEVKAWNEELEISLSEDVYNQYKDFANLILRDFQEAGMTEFFNSVSDVNAILNQTLQNALARQEEYPYLLDLVYNIANFVEGETLNLKAYLLYEKYSTMYDLYWRLVIPAIKELESIERININLSNWEISDYMDDLEKATEDLTEDDVENLGLGQGFDAVEKKNPVNTLSGLVRSFLSTIEYQNEPSDDLGYSKYRSLTKTYNLVAELCCKCRSGEEILELIEKKSKEEDFDDNGEEYVGDTKDICNQMQKKIDKLDAGLKSILGSLLFNYLHTVKENPHAFDKQHGPSPLRANYGSSFSQWMALLIYNPFKRYSAWRADKGIFNAGFVRKNVNPGNVQTLLNYYKQYIKEDKKEVSTPGGTRSYLTRSILLKDASTKINVLSEIFELLNKPVRDETIKALIEPRNKEALARVLLSLEGLIQEGLIPALNAHIDRGLKIKKSNTDGYELDTTAKTELEGVNFSNIVSYTVPGTQEKPFESNMKRLLNAISSVDTSVDENSYYRYPDKNGKITTFYDRIAPSHMYDLVLEKDHYLEKGQYKKYQKWFEKNFLNNDLLCKKEYDPVTKELKSVTFYNSYLQLMYEEAYTNTGEFNEERLKRSLESEDSYIRNLKINKELGFFNKKFDNCNVSEHYYMMLTSFLKSGRSVKNGSRVASIPFFTLGDSNSYKEGVGIHFTGNSEADIVEQAAEAMYRTFLGELAKFDVYDEIKDAIDFASKGVKEGFTRYTELAFLNLKQYADQLVDILREVQADNTLDDVAKEAKRKQRIKEEIFKVFITKRINDYLQIYTEYGYLNKVKTNDSGDTFEYRFSNKDNIYNLANQYTGAQSLSEAGVRIVIASFYATTRIGLMDLMGMFDGTAAFFKSVTDAQKRNKQITAAGSSVDVLALDKWRGKKVLPLEDLTERCAYFKDPKHNIEKHSAEEFRIIQMMLRSQGIKEGSSEWNKRISDYKEATITDGQAWRTLDSYRDLMIMLGRWNDGFENAYNEIKSLGERIRQIEAGTTDDSQLSKELLRERDDLIYDITELKVSFTSVKPFTFGFESVKVGDTTIKIPALHKCAEMVIIPEVLERGNKLRDLAEWADEEITVGTASDGEPITRRRADVLLSEEAVKVGGYNITDITEEGGVTNRETLRKALDGALIHCIPYSAYRLQSGVSNKAWHETLYQTQGRKIWYNSINLRSGAQATNYNHYARGNKVTLSDGTQTALDEGRKLVHFYNDLICANLTASIKEVKKKLSEKNIKELQRILRDGVFRDSENTINALTNFELTGDNRFITPLFATSMSKKTLNLILSMFKNSVNKLSIAGGTLVQGSPMGRVKYDDSGNLKFRTLGDNILYAECEIPFDLRINIGSREVLLKFRDYCNPDGTLKVGKILDENSTEYKSGLYQTYTTIVDGKERQYIPKLEIDFPGMLDLVAKRVPTERAYSMLRLRVARFTPMVEGGNIKVPAECTLLAGFDFDVDKLFLMRKEFNTKFSPTLSKFIWDSLYEKNDKILRSLAAAKAKEELEKYTGEEEIPDNLRNLYLYGNNEAKELYAENTDRLFKYWDKAKLEGTYADAFKEFVEKNLSVILKEAQRVNAQEGKEAESIFEEYDFNKTAEENSTIARNNMLLELTLRRLEDPETLAARMTPGGFFNASRAAKAVREIKYGDKSYKNIEEVIDVIAEDNWADPDPVREYAEVESLAYFNKQNLIAGKLIGVMANHNTAHAYATLFDKLQLRVPVAFGSHVGDALSDLVHRDNVQMRNYSELMVAELLAASVDAVKDPVLNYLNITSVTANVAALLARLGYSMYDIGILLNQPIIKDFCERAEISEVPVDVLRQQVLDEINSGNTSYSYNGETNSLYLTEEALIKGIKSNLTDTELQKAVFALFSLLLGTASKLSDITTLTKMSASNSVGSTLGFFISQSNMVTLVNELFKDKDSPIIVQLYNTPEYSTILSQNNNIFEDGYLKKLGGNALAMEQCFYDCNKAILELMSKYFPQASSSPSSVYHKIFEFMASSSMSKQISPESVDNVSLELLYYNLGLKQGSYFNPKTEVEGLLPLPAAERDAEYKEAHQAINYFRKGIVTDFIKYMESLTLDEVQQIRNAYPLLTVLQPSMQSILRSEENSVEESEDTRLLYRLLLKYGSGTDLHITKKEVEDNWIAFNEGVADDIIYWEGSEEEKLAKEQRFKDFTKKLSQYLVYHSYYTLGTTYSSLSFLYSMPGLLNTHIPIYTEEYCAQHPTLANNMTMSEYFSAILGNEYLMAINEEGVVDFFNLYLRNHPDDNTFVRTIVGECGKYVNELSKRGNGTFTISPANFDDSLLFLLANFMKVVGATGRDRKTKVYQYYPAIKVLTGKDSFDLYIALPNTVLTGEISYKTLGLVTYTKVSTLGKTNSYSQYYAGETAMTSDDFNNAPLDVEQAVLAIPDFDTAGLHADEYKIRVLDTSITGPLKGAVISILNDYIAEYNIAETALRESNEIMQGLHIDGTITEDEFIDALLNNLDDSSLMNDYSDSAISLDAPALNAENKFMSLEKVFKKTEIVSGRNIYTAGNFLQAAIKKTMVDVINRKKQVSTIDKDGTTTIIC